MYYFFIEQKNELIRELNKVLSENDYDLLGDIWDKTNDALYKKYDMPAVHLFDDGYYRGDATDTELAALAVRVKEGWKDCYYNDEDDETLFKSLDREFVSVFEEKVKAEIRNRLNQK